MNVKNTILLSLAVLSSTPGTTHPIETYNNPDTPAYNQVRERLYAQGYPAESIEQEIAEIREHFLSEGFNDTQIEQFIHVKNAVETAAKNLAIACKKNPEIKKAIQEWIELLAAKDATTIALAYKTLLPPRMYLEVEKNILESIPKTPTTEPS